MPNLIRRAVTVLGGMLLVAAVALPAAHADPAVAGHAPAAAALPPDPPHPCISEYVCVWVGFEYNGPRAIEKNVNRHWTAPEPACAGGTWDNCASSIWNQGRFCEVVVWELPGLTGASWVINRNTGSDNLSFNSMKPGRSWDNAISSNSWFC